MQTLIAQVLGAWRRAERLAESVAPGPEREAAQQACERLRDLYQALTDTDRSTLADPHAVQALLEELAAVGDPPR